MLGAERAAAAGGDRAGGAGARAPGARAKTWLGRGLSTLALLFLAFDGAIKLLDLEPVRASFVELGYPVRLAPAIGLLELACVALCALPRTAVLGAILLTAFLGGATASKARLEDPWLLLSVGVGVLVWAGLFLRERRLGALVPLRGG